MARLKEEEEKRQKMAEELAEKRQERISAEVEEAASSPVENHNTIKRIKKGDGATRLKHGDLVGVSFVGNFAAGTEHQGTEYGGSPFDTTIRPAAKPPHHKVDTPLVFRLGDGKAIRGMEECLKDMTLGERVEVRERPAGPRPITPLQARLLASAGAGHRWPQVGVQEGWDAEREGRVHHPAIRHACARHPSTARPKPLPRPPAPTQSCTPLRARARPSVPTPRPLACSHLRPAARARGRCRVRVQAQVADPRPRLAHLAQVDGLRLLLPGLLPLLLALLLAQARPLDAAALALAQGGGQDGELASLAQVAWLQGARTAAEVRRPQVIKPPPREQHRRAGDRKGKRGGRSAKSETRRVEEGTPRGKARGEREPASTRVPVGYSARVRAGEEELAARPAGAIARPPAGAC